MRMPRSRGPAAKGSPGLRKKRRPAIWAPASRPGRKPAASTSSPSSPPVRLTSLEDVDRAVDLMVEVPLVGVAGELQRHRVDRLHLDAISDPLHLDVVLVERQVQLLGLEEDIAGQFLGGG